MSPKTIVQAKKMANSRNGGIASFERKRRASSSSVSSVSSVSSLEELSEEAEDSEDDADDEEDRPLAQARSFGRRWNNSRKAGRQAAKAGKRIRVSEDEDSDNIISSDSEPEESSDDVYAAVDYITDAEDEEQDVEKLEEMMIMQSEREHRILPTSETSHDQWHGAEIFGDSMFLPAASFFDEEQIYSAMDTFGEPEIASEPVETSVARRVHFEERSDSSSDSDSHTEDEIPSDFLQQDSLDPQLRRMIESDNDQHRNHRRQSEEIFGDADYGHGNIYHVESEGTSEGSLSGYECMLAIFLLIYVSVLTHLQPIMATQQMRTFLLPPLLLTLAPFFVETLLTRWSLPMIRAILSPAVVAQSWARSWRTLTSL